MQALFLAYVNAVPAYLLATWQAAQYFYDPQLAAMAGGVVFFCLLLRIFLGGIGGKLVRLLVYGGLFYFISRNEQVHALFPVRTVGNIVSFIAILAIWLPVTILGGIIRAMRGGGKATARSGQGRGTAGVGGAGQPFNVERAENEKKQFKVIMMTDIVGYSARMEKDEAATYALLKEHNTIVRRAIGTNRGKEIKTIGDAFMVIFEEPLDALRCGVAILKELYKFNKPRPGNDQLKIRIGIHRGEVIVTAKDVFGEGVNIAARMESITEPGGISISADVYEHVKNKVEAGFQSIGVPKMKNIASPPEVFRVHLTHS
ncbi:MAG TPA: adenylate/guanylate cyclase domain-containing protein [Rhodospirillaceae bacterium]|nr:adenylate/guanylate cyclase domain-containing protein [Rhodospirillaceae bacterium]